MLPFNIILYRFPAHHGNSRWISCDRWMGADDCVTITFRDTHPEFSHNRLVWRSMGDNPFVHSQVTKGYKYAYLTPLHMAMGFIEKVKGFLASPVETFQKSRPDTLGGAFEYFIILLVIYSILSAVVWSLIGFSILAAFAPMYGTIMPALGMWLPVIIFISAIVWGIILVFIGGAWLHLWVYILGGRKGYIQTVKSLMYGSTPLLLIGWIPIVSIIGEIWTFILEILGIRELHEISTGRAIGAVIIAIIIPVIIAFIVALAFFMAIFSSGMVPSPY